MSKKRKYFYIGKGASDKYPWLFYGEEPPYIDDNNEIMWNDSTKLVGRFDDNPIGDSLKDNEVIKIYIKKETIKNKKNE